MVIATRGEAHTKPVPKQPLTPPSGLCGLQERDAVVRARNLFWIANRAHAGCESQQFLSRDFPSRGHLELFTATSEWGFRAQDTG